MKTFTYFEYKTKKELFNITVYDTKRKMSLAEADEKFKEATGLDASKSPHIGCSWQCRYSREEMIDHMYYIWEQMEGDDA